MSKDEILKKFEDLNKCHFHQKYRKWIIEAMQEYADQQLRLCGVSNRRELLPKSLSKKAYKCANKMSYEGFVDWWDLYS